MLTRKAIHVYKRGPQAKQQKTTQKQTRAPSHAKLGRGMVHVYKRGP